MLSWKGKRHGDVESKRRGVPKVGDEAMVRSCQTGMMSVAKQCQAHATALGPPFLRPTHHRLSRSSAPRLHVLLCIRPFLFSNFPCLLGGAADSRPGTDFLLLFLRTRATSRNSVPVATTCDTFSPHGLSRSASHAWTAEIRNRPAVHRLCIAKWTRMYQKKIHALLVYPGHLLGADLCVFVCAFLAPLVLHVINLKQLDPVFT